MKVIQFYLKLYFFLFCFLLISCSNSDKGYKAEYGFFLKTDEVDFRKSNIVLKVDTHEDVKKAYEEATSVIERV